MAYEMSEQRENTINLDESQMNDSQDSDQKSVDQTKLIKVN